MADNNIPIFDDTKESTPIFDDEKDTLPVSYTDTKLSEKDIDNMSDEELDAQLSKVSEGEDKESIGLLESAALGISEGATFGGSGIIGGASAALGRLSNEDDMTSEAEEKMEELGIEDPDPVGSLLETYYQGKKDTTERGKQAFEEHPIAYMGGTIAGGIPGIGAATKVAQGIGNIGRIASLAQKGKDVSKMGKLGQMAAKLDPSKLDKLKKASMISKAIPTAGLTGKNIRLGSKVGSAIKESTKGGALMGLTAGESELLRGDVIGTGGDIFTGTAYGAAVGTVASSVYPVVAGVKKVGEVFKDIGENVQFIRRKIDQFNWGKKGKSLTTKGKAGEVKDFESVRDEARGHVKELRGYLVKQQETIGKKMETIVDSKKDGVNLQPLFDDFQDELSAISRKARSAGGEIIDPNTKNDFDLIDELIDGIDGDVNNLDGKNTRRIIDYIFNATTEFEGSTAFKTNEMKKVARKFSETLKNKLRADLGEEYNGLMEDYATNSLNRFQSGFKSFKPNEVVSEIDNATVKFLTAADKAKSKDLGLKIDGLIKELRKLDPEQANQFADDIQRTGDQLALIDEAGVGTEFKEGAISRYLDVAANKLGLAIKKNKDKISKSFNENKVITTSKDIYNKGMAAKESIGNSLNKNFSKFVSKDPDELVNLSKLLSLNDNKYAQSMAKVLKEIAETGSKNKRTAMLYSLYQQPGFRKLIHDEGQYEVEDDN